jgi:fructokinase
MILCCGEALIDMIPSAPSGDAGFVAHIGGAAANTAMALGRLGAPVGIVTGLSTDAYGRRIGAALRASHVDTSLVVQSRRPTTLAFVRLRDGDATYSFQDENSALRMIRPQDLPKMPRPVSALLFGGISLCHAPVGDTMLSLAERHAGGSVIMFDPNVRPGFAADEAAYRARLARMIALADIVKISLEDMNWIYPGTATSADRIRRLLPDSVRLAVMTRGRAGASGWHANGVSVHVAAPKVDVVDTVGAGDTFNAGFLAKAAELGLLGKPALAKWDADQMRRIIAFGVKAASMSAARAGADPPWKQEMRSR